MTTLLSNFVEKVQTKHWQNLRKRTQKLNSLEKENLLELLEDNLAASEAHADASTENNNSDETSNSDEEEDYELLQRDLDKANLRLEELQSKHDFLQTRLDTYRSKIAAAQEYLETADLPPERSEALAAKIASYQKALQPIEATYQQLTDNLEAHQQKIESMQDRQLELKLKTQECKVVMEELCQDLEEKARLPYKDEDDQEILAAIETTNTESKETEADQSSLLLEEHVPDDNDGDVELSGNKTNETVEGEVDQQA